MRPAGFTVLEFVLAIVVTGVVAAAVVSGFRSHGVRGQVTSGMHLAYPWRRMVETKFRSSGQVPRTWDELHTGPFQIESIYVQAVRLVDGRIDIVYGNDASAAIAGKRLSLTPYETANGEVVWVCGEDTPGLGLQPLGFAGGGLQPTWLPPSIPKRYLPAACR